MKIDFLMDPLETIQSEHETTSHLIYECNERGHTVQFLEPHGMYIRSGQVMERMRSITVQPKLERVEYWQTAIRYAKEYHLVFETIIDIDIDDV